MKKTLLYLLLSTLFVGAQAQSVTTASSSMQAGSWGKQVPFNVSDAGKEFQFATGMGGWSDEQFAIKQRNWVGTENLGVARVGFTGRTTNSSSLPTSLSSDQTGGATGYVNFNAELNLVKKYGMTKIIILCGPPSGTKISNSYWNNYANRRKYYARDISLAVAHAQSQGFTVVGVAPFNEPDYNAESNCGNATTFNYIAELLKNTYGLPVIGPNTLNSTVATTWYNTVKGNVSYANTHQLAGDSFDDFVSFYETADKAVKGIIADEMHNVMEAMVAMNYGGDYGTWWGYDGVARAEFSRMANEGSQVAYKEDRENWATAGVYKHKTNGRVEAILGTSERNAFPSAFTFVSKGRLAYYDGYGPCYDYTQTMPGGTAYWTGQTNAERIVNISTGEDVPFGAVNGTYKLVNKANGKVLSPAGGSLYDAVRISVSDDGAVANQTWQLKPVGVSVGGDYSYHFITNANTSVNTYHLDDLDWGLNPGQAVIAYPGGGSGCEQWHVRYVSDGCYTIINRHNGLCLDLSGSSVVQNVVNGNASQLWKIVPADAIVDATAPAKPTGLAAAGQSGAVKLTWNANPDADIYGYMVYRYNSTADVWECVGRKVRGTAFLDNACRKGVSLRYRIKALDKSMNMSVASEEVSASTATGNALVGQWSFAGTLNDASANALNAVCAGDVKYNTSGTNAGVVFNGTDNYIKLPYHVGDMTNMTFAAWVNVGKTTAGQRIFDFGNGEGEYLYLTPRSSGGKMRFEVKISDAVQGLDATAALSSGTWTHVAVTIKKGDVKIYVNGSHNATSSTITILPKDIAPAMNYLGRSQSESDPLFNGSMGDVRIYNYALSASEVSALYGTKTTPNASDSSPYEITSSFIPSLATTAGQWTTTSGYTSIVAGSYTQIYNAGNKLDGTNTAVKTLDYMPLGKYRVTAEVATSAKATNVWVTAQDEQATASTGGTSSFSTFTVDASVAENDEYRFSLGLRQAYDQWNTGATDVRARNYRLYYVGTAREFNMALCDMLQGYIDEAQFYANEPMNSSVRSSLLSAINTATQNKTAYLDGTKTVSHAEVVATIEALQQAAANAEPSVTAYRALTAAILKARAYESDYPQSNTMEYYGLDAILTSYENGSYADAEITSAVNSVSGVVLKYLVDVATPTNPVDITSFVVKSASFEGSISGWTATAPTGINGNGLEYWNTNYDIYQILTDMPAGEYRFDAKAFYRNGWQGVHYDKYNAGTLAHNAKLYATAGAVTTTANIMPISDGASAEHSIGVWTTAELYGGNPVPDNMDAAGAAIDVYGKYAPANGYNSLMFVNPTRGDITIGAKKEVLEGGDWSFFGEVSLWYYGNYVELDENGAGIPETSRADANITLRRTIKGTTWNTICLPFSMSEEQVKETFGEDVQLRELTDAVATNGDANLYFTTRTSIEANKPYLMKNAALGSSYIIKGVDYTPDTPTNEVNGVLFNGVYAKTVLDNANGQDYYIVSNEIKSSPGTTNIKGFRAFFKVPAGSEVRAMRLFPEGDDEATAIEGVMTDEGDLMVFPADIYSVSGQLVRKHATGLDGLPRGIYIVGGQKIVVK